ncbi:MAG: sugar phosphate isomerase/epimerase [Ruminococcaceae bacterium]|nr:sugar phosphate isomerase/epimerase [Oscillospiraceae bacterium]
MRLGGSVMKPYNSPSEWLAQVNELGYRAVIFPVDCTAPAEVRREYLQCIKDNDLLIGEVGVWRNCMSLDPAGRERHIAYAIGQLELAEEVGARCCVNIAGAWSELWDGYHPGHATREYYESLVGITRRIIDAVQPRNTCFSLEPMPWMCPESPEEYLQLIKDIDREGFAVHLDYANMINSIGRYRDSSGFIRRCFELLTPHIRSIHAKDLLLDDVRLPLCIEEVAPGKGSIDLGLVLKLADALGDVPVFVEHLPDHEAYLAAANHMRAVAQKSGLTV